MNLKFIKRFIKIKALIFIFSIISSTNAGAFFWSSKIKILCYGEKSVGLILTYELKDREIYEEIISPKKENKSGNDELIRMVKLENCTIKDSKNWVCGGKATYQINGWYHSESHIVYEGRYKYMPGSTTSFATCVKRIQSN